LKRRQRRSNEQLRLGRPDVTFKTDGRHGNYGNWPHRMFVPSENRSELPPDPFLPEWVHVSVILEE
jgi:hypothetical protein